MAPHRTTLRVKNELHNLSRAQVDALLSVHPGARNGGCITNATGFDTARSLVHRGYVYMDGLDYRLTPLGWRLHHKLRHGEALP